MAVDTYARGLAASARPAIDLTALVPYDGSPALAAFASAMTTATTYRLRKGRYNLDGGVLTLPANSRLILDPEAVLIRPSLKLVGTVGAEQALTIAAVPGDKVINFDTVAFGGVAAGDLLRLRSCIDPLTTDAGALQTGYHQTGESARYFEEYVTVASSTSTTVTLVSGLRWTYPITPGTYSGSRTYSTVQRATLPTILIEGGKVEGTQTTTASIFDFELCQPTVRDVSVDLGSDEADAGTAYRIVYAKGCLAPTADRVRVKRKDFASINLGTGHARFNSFVYAGGTLGVVRNCRINGGFQTADFTSSSTYGIAVEHTYESNRVWNAYQGYTDHPGGFLLSAINNRMMSCYSGCVWRSPQTRVTGNISYGGGEGHGFYGAYGYDDGAQIEGNFAVNHTYGLRLSRAVSSDDNPQTVPPKPAANSVINNTFLRCAIGIKCDNSYGGSIPGTAETLIALNRFIGCAQPMIVEAYWSGLTIGDGNTFTGPLTGPAIAIQANNADITIGRQIFRDLGASGTGIQGPGDNWVPDATAFPGGASATRLSIAPQRYIGVQPGAREAGLPSDPAAYVTDFAYGNIARVGYSGVVDASGTLLLALGRDGTLTGSKADATAAAITASSDTPSSLKLALKYLLPAITINDSLKGATFGFNFLTQTYAVGGLFKSAPSQLTGYSFARSGVGSALSSAADQIAFFANAERITDQGMLIERAQQNYAPNPTFSGSPNAWPSEFSGLSGANIPAGLTATVTDTTYKGRTGKTVRISGTPTVTGTVLFYLASSSGANTSGPAVIGDTWTSRIELRLAGGSLANVAILPAILERSTVGAATGTHTGSAITPTSTLAAYSYSTPLTGATTALLQHRINMTVTNGLAVDVTLFIADSMMVKEATSALSFIPGTATRALDVATLAATPGANWSIFAQALMPALVGTQPLLQWDDGTDSNRIVLRRDSSDQAEFMVIVAGSTVYSRTISTKGGARTLRLALAYDGTNLISSCDGGTAVSAAAPAMPSGITTWVLGANRAGNGLDGYIQGALGFTTALSAADLAALQL